MNMFNMYEHCFSVLCLCNQATINRNKIKPHLYSHDDAEKLSVIVLDFWENTKNPLELILVPFLEPILASHKYIVLLSNMHLYKNFLS